MDLFGFHPIDVILLVGYLVLITYIGKRSSRKIKSQEDFFLAGRGVDKYRFEVYGPYKRTMAKNQRVYSKTKSQTWKIMTATTRFESSSKRNSLDSTVRIWVISNNKVFYCTAQILF